ncbi:hypothetical protein TG4357_02858 [Thalassovita gelatinovora]|uniref:Uncharacterized protein n=1 Tax=Thalassovita gelatinovora TaxID=53501 RepID=A0A0P1FH13_THAGE|nr:hypothetical protein [Thalassovita gelatinovora]QIZ81862.1 hypothetical protein HFZ77_15930 [Thalassovita gelatinovora]CUH67187.1 hypothetical protein TG4357_02858 [Thalassovita gelatinovora]SEP79032.1 hypothetical protein SAMN04488043_101402 [Thalassovita gelatinovora]
MIDPLQVRPDEGKGLRLFSLDVDRAERERLQKILQAAEPGLAAGRLADLLGVKAVDATRIEIFHTEDLSGFGLFNYLVKANGLPEAALDHDRARIDAFQGTVMILFSRAFHDQHVTLAPAAHVSLIGAWDEEPPELEFTPLRSRAAVGTGAQMTVDPAATPTLPRWFWGAILFVALAIAAIIAGLKGTFG